MCFRICFILFLEHSHFFKISFSLLSISFWIISSEKFLSRRLFMVYLKLAYISSGNKTASEDFSCVCVKSPKGQRDPWAFISSKSLAFEVAHLPRICLNLIHGLLMHFVFSSVFLELS